VIPVELPGEGKKQETAQLKISIWQRRISLNEDYSSVIGCELCYFWANCWALLFTLRVSNMLEESQPSAVFVVLGPGPGLLPMGKILI